jgi:hypothetical protein
MNRVIGLVFLAAVFGLIGCNDIEKSKSEIVNLQPDRTWTGKSAYPAATNLFEVGKYSAATKSGAGYFYDDVLEYRVWMCPHRGAQDVDDGNDYFRAFAEFERAAEFSKKMPGAEKPLVLIRQREWIDEPETGKYIPKKGERITEWQVEWLQGAKRGPNSISEFLKHPRPARVATDIPEEDLTNDDTNLGSGHE